MHQQLQSSELMTEAVESFVSKDAVQEYWSGESRQSLWTSFSFRKESEVWAADAFKFLLPKTIALHYWHPNKWDLWWRLGRPLHGRKLPKIADQEKPCNQTRSPVLVSILRGDASIWWILFMRPESPFFDAHSISDILKCLSFIKLSKVILLLEAGKSFVCMEAA